MANDLKWYFCVFREEENETWWIAIVKEDYWEKSHALDDRHVSNNLEEDGFNMRGLSEEMESTFSTSFSNDPKEIHSFCEAKGLVYNPELDSFLSRLGNKTYQPEYEMEKTESEQCACCPSEEDIRQKILAEVNAELDDHFPAPVLYIDHKDEDRVKACVLKDIPRDRQISILPFNLKAEMKTNEEAIAFFNKILESAYNQGYDRARDIFSPE